MLAKIRVVARVVMFSSPVDNVQKGAPAYLSTHATASDRYYGIAHDLDGNYLAIRASWDSLGLGAFGPARTVETSAPPYGGTHMLVTDLVPQGTPPGAVGTNAHGSPSDDF